MRALCNGQRNLLKYLQLTKHKQELVVQETPFVLKYNFSWEEPNGGQKMWRTGKS